ncbi:MAG: hypothetical protein JEZ02_12400 [Desulfatibacillum sp.]|nr:hypothetical protein [Desulfatibacillum sp.]
MKLTRQKGLKLLVVASLVLAMMTGSGCIKTAVRTGVHLSAVPVMDMMMASLLDSPSSALLKDGMASNVLLVTALAEMDPANQGLLSKTCFLYTAYGMMVEDQDPAYAVELYTIAKGYGMRSLQCDKAFAKGMAEGRKIPELTGALGEKYMETLCWTGLAYGLYLMQNMDDPMALMDMPDCVAMVQRSMDLDDTYMFGVGKAFMGGYYAMLPEFLGLGGGPDASKAMFEEARKVSDGKFLMVDVFEARFLSTYVDDQDRFDLLLNRVIEADSSALSGGEGLNDLAKVKAEYFLSIKDTLF